MSSYYHQPPHSLYNGLSKESSEDPLNSKPPFPNKERYTRSELNNLRSNSTPVDAQQTWDKLREEYSHLKQGNSPQQRRRVYDPETRTYSLPNSVPETRTYSLPNLSTESREYHSPTRPSKLESFFESSILKRIGTYLLCGIIYALSMTLLQATYKERELQRRTIVTLEEAGELVTPTSYLSDEVRLSLDVYDEHPPSTLFIPEARTLVPTTDLSKPSVYESEVTKSIVQGISSVPLVLIILQLFLILASVIALGYVLFDIIGLIAFSS